MSKITKIPSEIRNILSKKRHCSVMDSFSGLLESLHLDSRCLGGNKRANCQLSNLQLFQILLVSKSVTYSRGYRCQYASLDMMLGGRKVRLFFCRRAQREVTFPRR